MEDFLAGDSGRGWRAIVVPIAYGLAILYRPGDDALPMRCRDYLNDLHAAVKVTGPFFESCEANFLQLYLYSEHTKYHLDAEARAVQLEKGAHLRTVEAYQALESVYREATIYNEGLTQEYDRLQAAYATLSKEYEALL